MFIIWNVLVLCCSLVSLIFSDMTFQPFASKISECEMGLCCKKTNKQTNKEYVVSFCCNRSPENCQLLTLIYHFFGNIFQFG